MPKGRPKVTTGTRVVEAWGDLYFEHTYQHFRPSYAMIVMAEKISSFYTLTELDATMKYYFNSGRSDFIEFLYKIDEVFKASQSAVDDEKALEELIDSTTQQLKAIMKKEVGN